MGLAIRDFCHGVLYGNTNVGYNANPYQYHSTQGFVAGSAYIPRLVHLYLKKSADYPDPWPAMYIQIVTLDFTVIAQAEFPVSLLNPDTYTWLAINLSTVNGHIIEGNTYSISIFSSHSGVGFLDVGKVANNFNTGMAGQVAGDLDAAWSSLPNCDLMFEVWGIDRDNVLTTSLKTNSRNNAVIFGG